MMKASQFDVNKFCNYSTEGKTDLPDYQNVCCTPFFIYGDKFQPSKCNQDLLLYY